MHVRCCYNEETLDVFSVVPSRELRSEKNSSSHPKEKLAQLSKNKDKPPCKELRF